MSKYHIKSLAKYYEVYQKSVDDPELFWEEIAEEHFLWQKNGRAFLIGTLKKQK